MDETARHWFLGPGERGNAASGIDAALRGGATWTEGNRVEPIVHGATYFERLAGVLRELTRGDRVSIADWRGDRDVAFVGGIDLCRGRRDGERHLGDAQPVKVDEAYGRRPAWHDVHAEVRGPAVRQLMESFRERWNDPTPVEHRSSPLGRLRVR